MSRQLNMNSTVRKAIEFVRDPEPRIQRHMYNFNVQTKYLSDSQIYAEAYLRGMVNGRTQETISSQDRKILDEQMRTDYQRWRSTGVDLTPIVMDFRATPNEASVLIREMFSEFTRLEESGADIAAIGAQIEFGINILKRTNWSELDNEEGLEDTIDYLNEKYAELCILRPMDTTPTINVQRPEIPRQQFLSPVNRTYNVRPNANQQNDSMQYLTPRPAPRTTFPNQNTAGSSRNTDERMMERTNTPSTSAFSENQTQNSILSGRQNSVLVGPHRASSTVINLISKNVYEPSMDAIDQIETWESQARMLQFPIDYFLSYMEVLLSKDLQGWWSINRGSLNSWQAFKLQFLEDFGDNNRAFKAEQALANLTQGEKESFQQLFLRFSQLMKHIKPEKTPSDKLYSLKSSLKPELRAACLTASSICELKRMCTEFEGMEKVNLSRQQQIRTTKVNVIENSPMMEVDEKPVDYWNNEMNWTDCIEEEDRAFVIDEYLDKKKTAMSQKWTREQKKEWLKNQLCFNCDVKGHLQGQCDKVWKPHCAKCGNKNVNNVRECQNCSGNANSSMQNGA
jgi:hypothetical protein